MEEEKLKVFGTDILPIMKEVAFKIGVLVTSIFVGYMLVSGKPKACLDFYGIM